MARAAERCADQIRTVTSKFGVILCCLPRVSRSVRVWSGRTMPPVAWAGRDGPRRSGSAGMQRDVEVYPVAVVVSHGVVASLRTGFRVDITCPVGTGEDRWGDAFAVGGWMGNRRLTATMTSVRSFFR